MNSIACNLQFNARPVSKWLIGSKVAWVEYSTAVLEIAQLDINKMERLLMTKVVLLDCAVAHLRTVLHVSYPFV